MKDDFHQWGMCKPCGENPTNVCKKIPFLHFEYLLACERDCNGVSYPRQYIEKTTATGQKANPDIVRFADDIVKKGCYIGPGKNCDTRRNALKNKIKAAVRKMGVQHGKYARNLHCAAARKKGEMIPMENNKTVGDTYPLPYVYEPEFEITPENFQVETGMMLKKRHGLRSSGKNKLTLFKLF